jgi:hypothetical protein
MKKTIILFTVLAVFAVSCQKEALQSPAVTGEVIRTSLPAGYELPACVVAVETNIMAGQSTNVGTITVWNDETNVYVSYQMTGSYRVSTTHLYVGACASIPVNGAGNPRIGLYPIQTNHGAGVQTYTYTIPRSSLPEGCLCVSAHADVVAYNSSGSVVFSETGWGQGEAINDGGSWAMKFGYCLQDCDGGPR